MGGTVSQSQFLNTHANSHLNDIFNSQTKQSITTSTSSGGNSNGIVSTSDITGNVDMNNVITHLKKHIKAIKTLSPNDTTSIPTTTTKIPASSTSPGGVVTTASMGTLPSNTGS